jgi:hypothetical protein
LSSFYRQYFTVFYYDNTIHNSIIMTKGA